MNFPSYFIDRPVFASAIALFFVIAGSAALMTLPVSQYPNGISPPNVLISGIYPGASAKVVEETVVTPIEQQVNGAEGMIYMYSTSTNDGKMSINVTFDVGRDPDLATVDVQNRLALAQPLLPQDVTRQGITVRKSSPDLLMVGSLFSKDKSRDQLFLSNYASINIIDTVARIKGVGNVQIFGQQDYGMRIWLNPNKMAKLAVTATDISKALQDQNVQAPAGQIGQAPSVPGQEYQYTVQVQGRLTKTSEFENVIIKANSDGSFIRIKDVARVELGAQLYSTFNRLNALPSINFGVFLLPGANALETVNLVRKAIDDLSNRFPSGVNASVPYDTTEFITASIHEVLITLVEAFLLVMIVVFIFLQNWRAVIIPAITVPVSLLGAFLFFVPLGFSLNTLTLFGLVLAVGIVVDDAIVVVEAVQLKIDEKGMEPKEAAKAAMAEVSMPILAITLVLCAVFIPVAFLGGITGQLYRQFALTMAASVFLSGLNALTLSPALCGLLLKKADKNKKKNGFVQKFFNGFNRMFTNITNHYEGGVRKVIHHAVITLGVLALIFVSTAVLFKLLPTSFVPAEDDGAVYVNVQLPDGASLERTNQLILKFEDTIKAIPGVSDILTLGGTSIISSTQGSNVSTLIIRLKPWDERKDKSLKLDSIRSEIQKRLSAYLQAVTVTFVRPPIPGLGTTGGITLELQDRSAGTVEDLFALQNKFIEEAKKVPELGMLSSTNRVSVPQIQLNIDRDKVKALGIPLNDVFGTLQTFLGGVYVNDFNEFGRTYHTMIQADQEFRSTVDQTKLFYVRSAAGAMIPLSALASSETITGPDAIRRFNLYRTSQIFGSAAPGVSSGQAIKALSDLATKLTGTNYGFAWSGVSYQEVSSSGKAAVVYGMAIIFAFLFLAALYESWAIPFSVLLVLPVAISGALAFQWIRGNENNVYAQIGLVMLIGLAAKNAILIVEYAKERRDEGKDPVEAAAEASRVRFRPILMTSFAFILGIFPLVVAEGAGAGSRQALGTSVFGGMLASTLIGIFFTPTLYTSIEKMRERFGVKPERKSEHEQVHHS